jgi:hypothetical protein
MALIAIAGGAGGAAIYQWHDIGHSWWESPEYAAGAAQAAAEGALAAEGAALLVGSVASAAAPVIATGLCADGDCGNEISAATGAFKPGIPGDTGTGLGNLEDKAINVTQKRLDLVTNHLTKNNFTALQNDAMIARLQAALQNGTAVTGADASFYMHEIAEATNWYNFWGMATPR